MATILLLNFDPARAVRLSAVLRDRSHGALTVDASRLMADEAYIERYKIDVVLVDLSDSQGELWTDLARLCALSNSKGLPIPVLCYSNIYRGPAFELKVEELGARLAYGR